MKLSNVFFEIKHYLNEIYVLKIHKNPTNRELVFFLRFLYKTSILICKYFITVNRVACSKFGHSALSSELPLNNAFVAAAGMLEKD